MSESDGSGQVILYQNPNYKGTSLGFGTHNYGYTGYIPSSLLNTVSSLKLGPFSVLVLGSLDGTTSTFTNDTKYIKMYPTIAGDNGLISYLYVKPLDHIEGFSQPSRTNWIITLLIILLFCYLF